MSSADVPAAVALALAQGWRNRTRFFELYLDLPGCQFVIGTLDGEIVAMGMAVVQPPVGWLGALIVAKGWRGRGYGRAMTEELIRRLRDAGCQTISLEATDAGRPLYERMGFRLSTHYHQLQGESLAKAHEPPVAGHLRPMDSTDLPAVFRLDRTAVGEDRRGAITRLLERNGGWILEREGGLAGFLLPAERAYGAVIAPRQDDGIFLLDLHRSLIEPAGNVRAGIPDAHEAAWRALQSRGWKETWLAPRMLIGPDVDWHPEWIWGQINSAMG